MMVNYILVIASAIMMGFSIGYFCILIGKLKEYVALRKQEKSNWVKSIIDIAWNVSILMMFGSIALLLPCKVIWLFLHENMARKMFSLYLYMFVPSLIVFFLLFIKQGKIKWKKED